MGQNSQAKLQRLVTSTWTRSSGKDGPENRREVVFRAPIAVQYHGNRPVHPGHQPAPARPVPGVPGRGSGRLVYPPPVADPPVVRALAESAAAVARALLRELPDVAGVSVRVRVREGVWATYFRPPRPAHPLDPHVIQLGTRMVVHQLEAPPGTDTSGREMHRCGWVRTWGDTPRARLACVLVHEIAHLVAHLRRPPGQRVRTHGPAFRAVLLELHARGLAHQAWSRLRELAADPRLDEPVPVTPRAARRVARRAARVTPLRPSTSAFAPGDPVTWPDREGRPHHGTVRRVNPRTVSVAEQGRPATEWWRVPPRLLRRRSGG